MDGAMTTNEYLEELDDQIAKLANDAKKRHDTQSAWNWVLLSLLLVLTCLMMLAVFMIYARR